MVEREVVCWNATEARELGWHFSIRHSVFVEEQRLIPLTDIDEWDRSPNTIHVVGYCNSAAVGTVRLFPTNDSGTWRGDRLAVLPAHRETLVGGRLVQHATAVAADRSGVEMEAMVQVQNVPFFQRIGWESDGDQVSYYGQSHQPMIFDLSQVRRHSSPSSPENAFFELPARRDSLSPLLCRTYS